MLLNETRVFMNWKSVLDVTLTASTSSTTYLQISVSYAHDVCVLCHAYSVLCHVFSVMCPV